MRVRRAVPDDAPALQVLVHEGFLTYRELAPAGWTPPAELLGAEVERSREDLEDPRTFCLVALDDDERPVGTVRVIAPDRPSRDGTVPDRHLKHLFVAEPHWGSGLAVELHQAAVPHLTGVCRLFTLAEHGRARRFYEREGWHVHDGPFEDPRIGMAVVEYRR